LLKTKYDACLVTQIALVEVTVCESIAETREHVVQLDWPERNRLRDGDVDAAANDEIKSIVARRPHDNASRTVVSQIGIHVRMRAAKHRFDEGLDVQCPEFNYWPNVVARPIKNALTSGDSREPVTTYCT